jgi:hypothetical protein
MTDEKADWIFRDSPRGENLPIDCAYRFSFGKPIWDSDDLPAGWAVTILARDDPRVSHFPTCGEPGVTMGGQPVGLAFLLNPAGEPVATWDEGRWWTPEESGAWLTMLAVPATYVFAEGMREAQMPRWWRRRRKPRGQR